MIIWARYYIGHVMLPNTPIANEIHRKTSCASSFPKNGRPPFFTKTFILPQSKIPRIYWSIRSFPELKLKRWWYRPCRDTANSSGTTTICTHPGMNRGNQKSYQRNGSVDEEVAAEGPWGKWAPLTPSHPLLSTQATKRAIYLSSLQNSSWFACICICVPQLVGQWLHPFQFGDYSYYGFPWWWWGSRSAGRHLIVIITRLTCLGEEGNEVLFWVLRVCSTMAINTH